ncbi:DUF2274 domain-containing protein [Sphingopyxis indica]|uniref:DUF2274 domain-containing protein n=1 Tax=Sphingopyxis indica TaxID=436663 RepID=A0A239JUG8_9SPHN|nr:DUF2274 domain-containing protein [Sphingopyxis indica]SNT08524.1 hypothetical protein SAMN06295955_11140 [Sphingopyxis indica]
MTKLRLGPVADEKPVKLTLELSGRLYRELSDYAAAHASETGLAKPLPPERIAPPIIDRFIASDRAFGKWRRKA